jgi:hypothetical protein
MQRRSFLELLGATTMSTASHAAPAAPAYFGLEQYFLKQGTQAARLHAFLQAGPLEAAKRLGIPGPTLVMDAQMAPHMPQTAAITAYASLDDLKQTRSRRAADAKFLAARTSWEQGDEAPYEHYSEALLEAVPYTPPLEPLAEAPAKPRIYELRVYHSPTERQLALLHERFAGPETKIFARCGIHPVLYSSTLIGPMKPNLTYLIPFADLAAREKAWAAFGADPEWLKVRAESVARGGQISSISQISLYRATAYSPLK